MHLSPTLKMPGIDTTELWELQSAAPINVCDIPPSLLALCGFLLSELQSHLFFLSSGGSVGKDPHPAPTGVRSHLAVAFLEVSPF